MEVDLLIQSKPQIHGKEEGRVMFHMYQLDNGGMRSKWQ